MRKLVFIDHNGKNILESKDTSTWKVMLEPILVSGFKLVSNRDLDKNTFLISNNHHKLNFAKPLFVKNKKKQTVLIGWEPKVTDPKMHQSKNYSRYGLAFSLSIEWFPEASNIEYFNWPVSSPKNEFKGHFSDRKKRIVIIQSNKFSVIKGEQYSIRRKYILNLRSHLDLYGFDWNSGIAKDAIKVIKSCVNSNFRKLNLKENLKWVGKTYDNYKGTCVNKDDILSKYQIAIVIENSNDYVSEKLHHALNAGCCVLYLGPPLKKHKYINNEIILLPNNVERGISLAFNFLNKETIELENIAKLQKDAMIKDFINRNDVQVMQKIGERIRDHFLNN